MYLQLSEFVFTYVPIWHSSNFSRSVTDQTRQLFSHVLHSFLSNYVTKNEGYSACIRYDFLQFEFLKRVIPQ